MIIGKRTASVITALIGLAILSLPVAADVGEIDNSTPVQSRNVYIIEDSFDSSATYSMNVSLFGNDDADAVNAPVQSRMVEIVEDSLDPNSSVVMEVAAFGGVEATKQDAGAPVHERMVNIVEDSLDSSLDVAVSVQFSGEFGSQQDASAPSQERYVYIIEDDLNPEGSLAVINPRSSDPVYALLRQPDNTEDIA